MPLPKIVTRPEWQSLRLSSIISRIVFSSGFFTTAYPSNSTDVCKTFGRYFSPFTLILTFILQFILADVVFNIFVSHNLNRLGLESSSRWHLMMDFQFIPLRTVGTIQIKGNLFLLQFNPLLPGPGLTRHRFGFQYNGERILQAD